LRVSLVLGCLSSQLWPDGIYCIHSQAYGSIDNAFIEGDVIQVSLRVAGQVLKVYAGQPARQPRRPDPGNLAERSNIMRAGARIHQEFWRQEQGVRDRVRLGIGQRRVRISGGRRA
jgi:hypothetical protein